MYTDKLSVKSSRKKLRSVNKKNSRSFSNIGRPFMKLHKMEGGRYLAEGAVATQELALTS